MSSLNGGIEAAATSAARMAAFECPICAPKRYFVTEIGLRTHVADRHPWRSLPPQTSGGGRGGAGGGGHQQRGIAPSRPALPEPAWLRERQAEAATAAAGFHRPLQPRGGQSPSPPPPLRLPPQRHHHGGQGHRNGAVYGNYNNGNNHGNLAVTFDTQSQLSDDVFVDDGGGNSRGRQHQHQQHQSRQPYRQYEQQRQLLHALPLMYESSAASAATRRPQQPPPEDYEDDDANNEYPPPDYDATPSELDALDSSPRKRRDLATARRPWYDSDDYAGPRNLMEQPGGYYDDEGALGNGQAAASSSGIKRRMRREMEDRDSRIETLRLEIDRLWDERMRLLEQEAARTRVVREQRVLASTLLPGGELEPTAGLSPRRGFHHEESLGMMSQRHPPDAGQHREGHAFQPILPHSRLQLYRQQQRQPQHQQRRYPEDRRAIDY